MPDVRHVLTILAVSDVQRAAAFYTAAFGWTRSADVAVYVEFALPGGMRLGIYERTGFAINTRQVPATTASGDISSTELYLVADDLDAAIMSMIAAGGRVLSECAPRGWGDEVAYFADPDGNVLALARPLRSPTVASSS